MSRVDLDTMVSTFAGHADACLIEAQAAAIEGNLQRSNELRGCAETWVSLVRAVNGVADDDL